MSFRIRTVPSGHEFACAANETLLDAGLAAGLFLPYSCRSGVCNSCRGQVVEGEVDVGSVHPAHLTPADRSLGYAMLCQARPKSDLVVAVRELDPTEAARARELPARVLSLERVAEDVMVVKLGMPANEPIYFLPGQYLEIQLPDGTRRNYSMANVAPAEGTRQLELHIRYFPGGRFSEHVFHRTKPREMWRIKVPLGTFYLRQDSERPIIMLASGTGFAPIKSIIEHSLAKGLTRPITLYWGGRRPPDLYMRDVAERWAADHSHVTFIPVLSEASEAHGWTGRTGYVHQAVLDDHADLSEHEVYVCGAPIVVDLARSEFTARRRLPAERFHADSFITAAEKASVATDAT